MEERTGGFGSVKRKRGRFNLIDLIIVMFAVAAVLFVVFVLDPFSLNVFSEGGQKVVLEYTVQFDYVEASLTDNIKPGDEVIGASGKNTLGRVSSIRNDTLYSEIYYNTETDTVSMKEYPDRYNIRVTVMADALFVPGTGYTVNGTRIAVGSQYSLMFPEYLGTGYCVAMREVG